MHRAESYDLDGIVIHSAIPFRFDSLSKLFRSDPVHYESPTIVPVNRDIEETFVLPFKQIFPYLAQSMRSVDRDMWEYLWNRTADVYGNTGRPNKRPWVEMTKQTLRDGEVLQRFKKIYFRPRDVAPIQSKGAALAELSEIYDDITHIDDDPFVVYGLYPLFPKVHFILVQGLSFGTPVTDEEKRRFPNVERVAQLSEIDPE
jgi:hypothetical protein